jgi:hypothetical protein
MATGAPNAILAISSLDRYIYYLDSNNNQPFANIILDQYEQLEPYSNNFTLPSPGALIYGYINRIVISQIQLQYCIPTVIPNRNDRFFIGVGINPPLGPGVKYPVTMPYGFYTPDELAAMLQTQINAVPQLGALAFTVTYNSADGFVFDAVSDFYFPTYARIVTTPGESTESGFVVLKAYKLLGITIDNQDQDDQQISLSSPNFLYTPYIDFFSDILTNYQNMKDTNSSISKPKGLIARVYLSGNGSLQSQIPTAALGSAPFVVTADMNSPKIIKWTPDVAVNSIDFQLRDCYGDLIPAGPEDGAYSTEFQMTLLCVEDD